MKLLATLGATVCLVLLTPRVVDCQNRADFYTPRDEYNCSEVLACSESQTDLLCRCDADCGQFGDCCDSSSSGEESATSLTPLLQCRSVLLDERTLPDWGSSFWMVSACPVNWLDGREDQLLLDTVNNCSRGSANLPPVTDLDTGVVYKNEYCAVCHEAANFRQWGYTFECHPDLRTLAQDPDFQLTVDILDQYCLACGFRDPHLTDASLPAARACFHHSLVDDSCLTREELEMVTQEPIEEQLYQEIVEQCQRGPVAPVRSSSDSFYTRPFMNQHCALCNGVRLSPEESECVNPYNHRNPDDYCRLEAYRIEIPSATPPEPETEASTAPTDPPLATDTEPTQTPTEPSPATETELLTTSTTETEGTTPPTRLLPRPLPDERLGFDSFPTIVADGFILADDLIVTTITETAPTAVAIVPFTVVVDIDRNTQTFHAETRTFTSTTTCDDGELFDLISGSCRRALCPEVARGELCEQVQNIVRPETFNTTDDNSTIDSFPCNHEQLTFLDESEFEVVDNTTLEYGGELFEILGYINDSAVICTNFSQNGTIERNVTVLLFSYPEAFSILTYVGCSLSVVGCAFVLLTYSLFKELQTLPGKILMNLSAAIMATSVFLLIGIPLFALSEKEELCQTTAIFLHWLVLSEFSWMTVMSFELARTMFRASHLRPTETKKFQLHIFLVYLLIGWGIPTLITAVSLALNYTTNYIGYGEEGFCWISDRNSFFAAFLAPLCLSLLVNGITFTVTTYLLFKAQRGEAKLQKQKSTSYLRIYLSVFSITGLTWVFGFVAILAREDWAWYLFIILNSSQGFTICLAFLFTQKIFALYKEKFWSRTAKLNLRSTAKESMQDTSSTAVRYVKKGENITTTTSTRETEFGPATEGGVEQSRQEPVHYVRKTDEERETQ